MLPKIAIIGRPNVGKSSLFNAISGHKIAIVSDIENTTRDILEFQYNDKENNLSYIIADSGGLNSGTDDEVLNDVKKRVEGVIEESEIILFVLECDKISELDYEITKILRKTNKDVILIGNKADNIEKEQGAYDLYKLGFKDIIFASVSHRKGIDEIKKLIGEKLVSKGYKNLEENYDDTYLKLAIIGRPNVGKSSIVNAITGENKVMVRDMPGTTRDSVDSVFEWNNNKFVLIDTAGIRRSGKIGTKNIENWSVMRSERAITRSDVVAVVIDSIEGVTAGDQHIVQRALEEKKGIILVINKWDLSLNKPGVDKENIMNKYISYLKRKFDFLSFVTPVFTSAVTGKRLEDILETAQEIKNERQKRVKTSIFNNFIEQVVYKHPPTGNKKSHKPKIYYGSQVDVNPPRFVISVNNPKHFHFSYSRYLENKIREHFGFFGTPIDIELKGRESLYKK